jgi:hypothetical protein
MSGGYTDLYPSLILKSTEQVRMGGKYRKIILSVNERHRTGMRVSNNTYKENLRRPETRGPLQSNLN